MGTLYISFPFKIMISPLASTCFWTDNISFISEKGWINIYMYIYIYINQMKAVGWDSLKMYGFFSIPHIIQDIYCRRIWLTQTFPQKGSTVLRKRWKDIKNIFRSRQSDLISRQSDLTSRQSDLISRQTIQLWRWNIAAGTTMGPSLSGIHQLSFRWRQG